MSQSNVSHLAPLTKVIARYLHVSVGRIALKTERESSRNGESERERALFVSVTFNVEYLNVQAPDQSL